MKKHTMSFVAGLLTGAMLFGGGVAYAAGVMAEYAPQQAYVDGVPVGGCGQRRNCSAEMGDNRKRYALQL